MAKSTICSVAGCGKPVRSRGLCDPHHKRYLRHGDPLKGRTNRGEAIAFLFTLLSLESDECIEWPYGLTRGYPTLRIKGVPTIIHRHVCAEKHGAAPTANHQAAHNCGNRKCVNYRHLRWATRKENEADKLLHGTRPMGEKCNLAKITAEQAAFIKASPLKQRELARMFGLTQPGISRIKTGHVWR